MAAVAKKRKADPKPICKYGSKCYRKNPQHIQNYRHPGRDDEEENDGKLLQTKKKKGEQTIDDYFGSKSHDSSNSGTEDESDSQSSNKMKAGPDTDSEKQETSEGSSSSTKTKASEEDRSERKSDEKGDAVEEEEEETEEPPASPEDVKENIKQKFLVEMPDDFYQFWEFCKTLDSKRPMNALEKTIGLRLVGPFDILADRHKGLKKNKRGKRPNFLLHWRYFYDPPEFQTVLAAVDSSKLHFGYFRDDPNELPAFVAYNSPHKGKKPEKIVSCGENLFAAINNHAKSLLAGAGEKKKTLQTFMEQIEEYANKHKYALTDTPRMKARAKRVVCPAFHGAGIVVPIDDNEVGYREVPETEGDLRAMLKRLTEGKSQAERDSGSEDVQELITLVQFANDECDFGEGLELGMDLFCYGSTALHPQISVLLPLAYQLLNRNEFAQIIQAHLKRRTKLEDSVDELAT